MSKEKVGMYSEQVRGVSYKESDIHDSLNDQSVTLLRANNIFDNELNFDNVVYIDKSRVSDKQYLRKGDIVVCASSGSKNLVGKAAQVDFDTEVTFGAFLKVVRPKNIIPKYLGYYFLSNEYRRTISSISEGANINNIRNEHIDDLLISIVDNDTQKMQSEILDKVYGILKRKKQQLTEYDQLIKSRFVEMFGNVNDNTKKFVQEKLSNHLNIQGGYAFDSKKYLEEGIPILRIGNINTGIFIDKELKYWEYDENLVRYLIKPGDLLITLTGTVGKDDYGNVCIIDNSFPYYYLNQRNAKLDVFDTLTPIYLKYLLLNNSIKNRLTGISRGVRQANISNRDILNLNVPIPSIELQNQFTEFVEQVDKLKFKLQKSVDEAQLLFDSLLQKYFG